MTSTVLFDLPQREIASLITDRMTRASDFSIITGFATPGGLASISGPIRTRPQSLKTLVVGAATYPGFEALDQLLAAVSRRTVCTFISGIRLQPVVASIPLRAFIPCFTARSTTWSMQMGALPPSSAPTT